MRNQNISFRNTFHILEESNEWTHVPFFCLLDLLLKIFNIIPSSSLIAVLSNVIMRMTRGGLLVIFQHIWVSYSPKSIQLVHKRSLVSLINPFALLLRPLMVMRLLQPGLLYFQIYCHWLRSTVRERKVPQNFACSSLLQISWKIDLAEDWRSTSFRRLALSNDFHVGSFSVHNDVGCGSLSW